MADTRAGGRLPAPSEVAGAVSRAAGQTTMTWLLARGLVAEIDDLGRRRGISPAAGGVGHALGAVATAVDRAETAANEIDEQLEHGGVGDVLRCLHGALLVEQEARAWLRRLAQLAVGVSTYGGERSQAVRLQRAGLELIGRTPWRWSVVDDDRIWLAGDRASELRVDLAGLVRRLMIERTATVVLGCRSNEATLTHRPTGRLVLESRNPSSHQVWEDLRTPDDVIAVVDTVVDLLGDGDVTARLVVSDESSST